MGVRPRAGSQLGAGASSLDGGLRGHEVGVREPHWPLGLQRGARTGVKKQSEAAGVARGLLTSRVRELLEFSPTDL